jgi:hypothetical protein
MTPALLPPVIIHEPVVAAALIKPLLKACFTLYGSENLKLFENFTAMTIF